MVRKKNRGKISTFSASLTTKQIEWLRSHFKPQEVLRDIIDNAMENDKGHTLEALKKQDAEISEMLHLLGTSAQVEKDEERAKDLAKRLKTTWAKLEEVRKKISELED